ncbi:serine hydrolase [Pseudarthrobacter equi]|uniref:serine hydrolase domain-containing protein n=1 Tax=Pseudarthrobacter equi TaxID=728066 RepID=UPI0021C4E777|nr:serine hydrolase [Pseudarthrobacter equi]MCT9623967.1 serine hydrolase [Pseudarthrobacter equi]
MHLDRAPKRLAEGKPSNRTPRQLAGSSLRGDGKRLFRAGASMVAATFLFSLATPPAGALSVDPGSSTVATTELSGSPAADTGAKQCGEPGNRWERATPSEAGFDGQKLQEAVTKASLDGSAAVRVYRYGCLVAEDALSPEGRALPTPSMSVAKSVTSLLMGRAWTQGKMSPSDPVGSLFPEADYAHGKITVDNLATMTSGNDQTLAHDYNVVMPDRVRDALTVPLIHEPGEYYNYWQSGVALLAEAVTRSVGQDIQDYAQDELFGPIGISRDRWSWLRDPQGHTAGYYGLSMTVDDYGRFGELLRRDGVWKGQRLLSQEYTQYAVSPSDAYPCVAAHIWRPALPECNGAVGPNGDPGPFLGLPSDMWEFQGAAGQFVTVFPTQGVMIVRAGADDATATPTSQESRREFLDTVLGALNEPVATPHLTPRDDISHKVHKASTEDPFYTGSSVIQPSLPAPGPRRARASNISENVSIAANRLVVLVNCPPVHFGPAPGCAGALSSDAASDTASYNLQPGAQVQLQLRLTSQANQSLTKNGELSVAIRAVNRDGTAEGTIAIVSRLVKG